MIPKTSTRRTGLSATPPTAALLSALMTALGCGDVTTPPQDMTADLASAPDLALWQPPYNGIGARCAADRDCGEGTQPTCARSIGNEQLPEGYCSSPCTDNAQCGRWGVCVDLGAAGRWCLAACANNNDCRSTGYACWLGGDPYCWVTTAFDCDPQAGDGYCGTAGPKRDQQGGCVRAALGRGKRGFCQALCSAGKGTCPSGQSCLVTDQRRYLDGDMTGDKFVGPVCTGVPRSGLNPVGQECRGGDDRFYTNVCVDGAECYLKGGSPAGSGFDAAGDNKCKQLCYLPGGGTGPTCPTGTTCKDIFGLKAATNPQMRVGMCN